MPLSLARLALGAALALLPASTRAATPLYVAPNGSDGGGCSRTAPCKSFDRAYHVARPGAIVYVTAGTYPAQTLSADASKVGKAHVTFQSLRGAASYVASLDFGDPGLNVRSATAVTVNGLHVGEIQAQESAADLRWVNVVARSSAIASNPGSTWERPHDIQVRGGVFGPCTTAQGVCTTIVSGRRLLVDGAYIHGQRMSPSSTLHVDGMFVRGCSECTIRRTHFDSAEITDVRIQNVDGLVRNRDVVLENNWFGAPLQGDLKTTRADAIDVDESVPGLVIRFNSFGTADDWWGGRTLSSINAPGTVQIDGTPGGLGTADSPARVYGNVMGRFSCAPNTEYSDNVWVPFQRGGRSDRACGVNERRVASATAVGYLDGGRSSGRLRAGAPANGHVRATTARPSDDIAGRRRPRGRCDAGAYER
jgi:hypothetical protein